MRSDSQTLTSRSEAYFYNLFSGIVTNFDRIRFLFSVLFFFFLLTADFSTTFNDYFLIIDCNVDRINFREIFHTLVWKIILIISEPFICKKFFILLRMR